MILISKYMLACSVTRLCPTLCKLRDCSPPGSSVHGILQARILEWIIMPSSRGSSWPQGSCIFREVLYHQCYVGSHAQALCLWWIGAVSRFFASGGQSIRASASVLPMNIQDWFPLGWTGWISLQSKGLLRVFSSTTTWKHKFRWFKWST